MIRWRLCLVLAMLLMIPTKSGSKLDDDDDDDRREEGDDDDDEEEDEEEQEPEDKHAVVGGRRSQILVPTAKTLPIPEKKRPLECFVCAYKADTPLRACLDPTKFRVHTITCHSADDKCFTSVITKGTTSYEAVVRGCRSGCVGSSETTCCELDRCNNHAFALPSIPSVALTDDKSDEALGAKVATKNSPSSILFFVTILLVLQTVIKVPFVLI